MLELLVTSDRPLTVDEIAEKLGSDYDKPPTQAAVVKVHADRQGPHMSRKPTDS